ncbi:PepSY domain-containing protein [Enterococcus villorum]|uniref:Lipoprotein n=2 Tax=Enterococcus villorum TaxID=112904 RepID=A0A511IY61_9ENTE|nr:PepSY domain-containing protein [Enterococcus villorum]EOH89757.1 lipoprotein [Enterococcus villorum ATCC 700913]EOW77989.1 lipoprotein [Enterococcus villorum ATCC 700913]GEL90706.1 lipoprotein [Enterococcus villorum]
MKTNVIYFGLFSLLLLTGCQSNPTTPSKTPSQSSSSTVQQQTTNASSQQSTDKATTATSKDIKVSAQKAIELFQRKYPDAAVTSLELDSSWGSYFYKVDGVDDQNEYEVKINASNEEMQTQNPERLDLDEQNGQKKKEDALDTSNLISIEKAADIAVKEVGGGEATDWELNKELGTIYWEVKVKKGNQTTQVKLNSQTGKILATEIDD